MKPYNVAIIAFSIVVFVAGAVLFSNSIILADDLEYPEQKAERDGPTLTSDVPRLPRPSEASSVEIDAAVDALAAVPALASVLSAVERGDVQKLLDSARQGNFCDRVWREGETPEECVNSDHVPAVFLEGSISEPYLMPMASVREWLGAVTANMPVELTLAARGTDGNTYLVFKGSDAVDLGGSEFDSVGIVVNPEDTSPIQWFRLIMPTDNGVEWLQLRAAEAESSPRFELIAPKTVKDWPGLWGETAE